RLPEAQRLLAALRDDDPPLRLGVRGLTGSARGWLIAWLHRELGGTLLVVSPHGDRFEELRDDLEYFRGPGSVLAYPEPDVLPYDSSSPHPSLTAQRLETLERMGRGEPGIVLTTV